MECVVLLSNCTAKKGRKKNHRTKLVVEIAIATMTLSDNYHAKLFSSKVSLNPSNPKRASPNPARWSRRGCHHRLRLTGPGLQVPENECDATWLWHFETRPVILFCRAE